MTTNYIKAAYILFCNNACQDSRLAYTIFIMKLCINMYLNST